jgi:transcriptional regulator with XRE-family HTH domain
MTDTTSPRDDGDLHTALGKKIRQQRQSSGLTQAELADRLSISRTSLTNVELGRQRLLVDQLYKMADVLNTRPQDLLPQPSEIIGASSNEAPQESLPESVHQFVRKVGLRKKK